MACARVRRTGGVPSEVCVRLRAARTRTAGVCLVFFQLGLSTLGSSLHHVRGLGMSCLEIRDSSMCQISIWLLKANLEKRFPLKGRHPLARKGMAKHGALTASS